MFAILWLFDHRACVSGSKLAGRLVRVLITRECYCSYICVACRRARRKPYYFCAYDPGTLRLLAETPIDARDQSKGTRDLSFLANQFPAFPSHKRAVSIQLMDILQATIGTGSSFQQLATTLGQMYRVRFSRLYDTYLSYELASRGRTSVELSLQNRRQRQWPPQHFSSFGGAGFSGRAPTAAYILAIALAYHRHRRPVLLRRLMQVTGRILKGDMSFKLAKKIRCARTGQYTCVFSLMNEFGEILGYWFCRSKSLAGVRSELQNVQARYQRETGQTVQQDPATAPSLWYTDSCCEEFDTLTSIFPSLVDCTAVTRDASAPMQSLRVDDVRGPGHNDNTDAANNFTIESVVTTLITTPEIVPWAIVELRNTTSPYYGFDMEWQVYSFVHCFL